VWVGSWGGVNRHREVVPQAYRHRIAHYLLNVHYYFKDILFEWGNWEIEIRARGVTRKDDPSRLMLSNVNW
jgi:hypothetical protein